MLIVLFRKLFLERGKIMRDNEDKKRIKALAELTEEFIQEPYASLWRKLASNNPWGFTKEDIPYSEDKNYIK